MKVADAKGDKAEALKKLKNFDYNNNWREQRFYPYLRDEAAQQPRRRGSDQCSGIEHWDILVGRVFWADFPHDPA